MLKIDFDDARYRVKDSGVAWYLTGWAQRWEPELALVTLNENGEYDPDGEEYEVETDEGEWVDDPDSGLVRAVMVGDDTEHLIDVDDLSQIDPDDYCPGCGQIGCNAYRLGV